MSIVINRSIEEVFAILANLENDVEWRREWIEAKNTSEGPLGVGATSCLVSEFLGRRNEVEYEVTEYEPNRTKAWKAVSGPLPQLAGADLARRLSPRPSGRIGLWHLHEGVGKK